MGTFLSGMWAGMVLMVLLGLTLCSPIVIGQAGDLEKFCAEHPVKAPRTN